MRRLSVVVLRQEHSTHECLTFRRSRIKLAARANDCGGRPAFLAKTLWGEREAT
jgi:hypothetical protein